MSGHKTATVRVSSLTDMGRERVGVCVRTLDAASNSDDDEYAGDVDDGGGGDDGGERIIPMGGSENASARGDVCGACCDGGGGGGGGDDDGGGGEEGGERVATSTACEVAATSRARSAATMVRRTQNSALWETAASTVPSVTCKACVGGGARRTLHSGRRRMCPPLATWTSDKRSEAPGSSTPPTAASTPAIDSTRGG